MSDPNEDPNLDPSNPPADPPANPPQDPPADPPKNLFASIGEGDWRSDLLAISGYEGEDAEKYRKQLERVADIGSLTKNYFEAQNKIRQGLISTGLPKDATPEQIAEYREANGIPESFDKYKFELEDGLEIDDQQAEVLAGMLEVAHANNTPNSVVNEMVNTLLKGSVGMRERREQQDGMDAQESVRLLKDAWKSDYQTNVNMVENLLATMPAESREMFENARLPDGKLMLNDPAAFMWLSNLQRELNPAGVVFPNNNNPAQAINDEIAKLEARMGDDDWHSDVKANDRLLELYTAREKMQKR